MLTVTPRLPGENSKEYSYRIIKDGIMALQLQPGQALREVELAEALNLSRTPVREVMAKLNEEYLVNIFPQVGTYVSKINPQLIREASFMRFTLEKEVLKQACESFPNETLIELKKNLALQKELVGCKGMEREFHKFDKSFHQLIYQGVKKENVWAAITRISTHHNRIRLLSEMKNSFDQAIAQHLAIIQIIENKACDQAENIVRQHILEPAKLWIDLIKDDNPYSHYFEPSNEMMPVFQ